jgi:hypothetical protein
MIYNENHPLVWNLAKRLVDPEGPWLPSFLFMASAVAAGVLISMLIR